MSPLTLFMTGEGPSDIGTRNHNGDFVPGVMAHVAIAVAKMYGKNLTFDCRFTSENELTKVERAEPSFKRQPVVEGRGQRTKKFSGLWLRARAYAKEVCEKADPKPDCRMAIIFTDADGTHTASHQICQQKYEAILNGFEAGGCQYGVPMVPRPKSEAWLLAYFQRNKGKSSSAYQNCARFENLAGNDKSQPKNSAKHILDELLHGDYPGADEIGEIDWGRVDMPSFQRFKNRVEEVLSGQGVRRSMPQNAPPNVRHASITVPSSSQYE